MVAARAPTILDQMARSLEEKSARILHGPVVSAAEIEPASETLLGKIIRIIGIAVSRKSQSLRLA